MDERAMGHCEKCDIDYLLQYHTECPYCKTRRLEAETREKEQAKRSAKKAPLKAKK